MPYIWLIDKFGRSPTLLDAILENVIGFDEDGAGVASALVFACCPSRVGGENALRRTNPKSLCDDDLAKACVVTPLEEWLFASGCLGSVIALVLLVLASLIFESSVELVLMAAPLLIAIFGANRLVQRFKQPFRDEYDYRSGKAAISIYMNEAEAALDDGQADWVVLFTAPALPHGPYYWLRIDLQNSTPPSGKADRRISGCTDGAAYKFRRDVTDFSGDEAADLLSMIAALDLDALTLNLDALTDFSYFVYDDMPCTLAVLRGTPAAKAVVTCNLDSLSPEEALKNPAAHVCARLLAFARRSTGD